MIKPFPFASTLAKIVLNFSTMGLFKSSSDRSISSPAFDTTKLVCLFISNVEYSDFIIGDINGDEVLDILDVVVLINAVLDDEFYEEADMNQDGVLDILDIVLLVNVILE